jgi:PAS domain S-box-containing protein
MELQASILAVDDNKGSLMALKGVLAELGHRVVTAGSGEEALRRVLEEDFAVILLDVQMPGMDGYETARMIKARERSRYIPIIFITGNSRDEKHVFKGYSHGAVDYLLKPFVPEVLLSKVRVFVDLHLMREKVKVQEAMLREQERAAMQRQSDLRWRQLLDAMPLCMWGARPDGTMFYSNRRWQLYSGLSSEESAHAGLTACVHPDDVARLKRAWDEAVRSAGAFELPYRLRRHVDGTYRWHLGRAVPERDEGGVVVGFVVTAADIEDERHARDSAEAESRAKDEFLAVVSHELRTPLTAILGWTHLLSGTMLDEAGRTRALETIDRNARLQSKLVDDILDTARIMTGKLRIERQRVDLTALVDAAIDAIGPALKNRKLTFEVAIRDRPVFVDGDGARLQQVIGNLLSNAAKFTSAGGTVSLSLEATPRHATLTVRDTGCGITPEFLPYVFDRFRQADSTTSRSQGGLGLGLAIVHHIVEIHDGTVEVSSAGVGHGSAFTVTLPCLPEPERALA